MKRVLVVVGIGVALLGLAVLAFFVWQGRAASDPAFFESEIRAFEAADATAPPEPGGILFVGSSSIRFWDTLAEDMAPLPVVRRGFGGAHMEHVLHNARRIVIPYAPRAVVVFVGGNDIGAGKSSEHVLRGFREFVDLLHAELPEADVWLLSMKPSKLRWGSWSEMARVDEGLRALAEADPRVRFVETGRTLLGPDGVPDDVYVFDGLHLNAEGYRRWTAVLRPLLMAAYGPDAGSGHAGSSSR
ncbi:MAG: GDSL-type esterase/lipase family protein [Myxococcota bacterium]